ncbi:MAG: hypothetical protein JNL74_05020 [Fibrobacteres bacterium]|nr:hypothetical protein [Fibrobacterota bacterium]
MKLISNFGISSEEKIERHAMTIAKCFIALLLFVAGNTFSEFNNVKLITLGPVIRFGGSVKMTTQVGIELGYWHFVDGYSTVRGIDIGFAVSKKSYVLYVDWQTMMTNEDFLPSVGTSIGPALVFQHNKPVQLALKASLWAAPYIALIETPTLFLGKNFQELYVGCGFKFGRGLGKDDDFFSPNYGYLN